MFLLVVFYCVQNTYIYIYLKFGLATWLETGLHHQRIQWAAGSTAALTCSEFPWTVATWKRTSRMFTCHAVEIVAEYWIIYTCCMHIIYYYRHTMLYIYIISIIIYINDMIYIYDIYHIHTYIIIYIYIYIYMYISYIHTVYLTYIYIYISITYICICIYVCIDI